jgi:hypothetical protein
MAEVGKEKKEREGKDLWSTAPRPILAAKQDPNIRLRRISHFFLIWIRITIRKVLDLIGFSQFWHFAYKN